MGSRIDHYQNKTIFFFCPNQKPIGFDVTFPKTGIVPRQFVGLVFLLERACFFKFGDNRLKQGKVITSLFQ